MDPREREAKEAKARQRQQLLDRAYDEVVAKQLEKLNAKKTFTGEVSFCGVGILYVQRMFMMCFEYRGLHLLIHLIRPYLT